MLNRFQDKIIAIAGGSGGIGSATSQRLAAEGATVIVGDINMDATEKTVAVIEASGGRALPFKLDIADEESVKSFVHTAVTTYGGIDGFYANAVDTVLRDDDTDPITMKMSTYDQQMHINLRGYFLCTRHAVPHLVARGAGCMLYTSSGAAYIGMPDRPVYAIAKSGLHALMRHVASKFGKQGVRSNCIAPGLMLHPAVQAAIRADVLEASLKAVKLQRLGKPDDIAAMAALLLSDDGAYVTGQVITVDGGHTMRA